MTTDQHKDMFMHKYVYANLFVHKCRGSLRMFEGQLSGCRACPLPAAGQPRTVPWPKVSGLPGVGQMGSFWGGSPACGRGFSYLLMVRSKSIFKPNPFVAWRGRDRFLRGHTQDSSLRFKDVINEQHLKLKVGNGMLNIESKRATFHDAEQRKIGPGAGRRWFGHES